MYDVIMKTKTNKWKLIFLFSLLLFACRCSAPTDSDIIGFWVEHESTCNDREVVQCASIEFYGNGRFYGKNLPLNDFCDNPIENTSNVWGNWELEVPDNYPIGLNKVHLYFDPSPIFPWGCSETLYPSGRNGLVVGVDTPKVFFDRVDGNNK
jgi:hypothetical protein